MLIADSNKYCVLISLMTSAVLFHVPFATGAASLLLRVGTMAILQQQWLRIVSKGTPKHATTQAHNTLHAKTQATAAIDCDEHPNILHIARQEPELVPAVIALERHGTGSLVYP